ncbi:hypothetical protein AHiyo8_19390 [Arthrobacter sp. Hiyo8]|nr:hypothetical protein AHiyo8_19390 [Arthrobacter sp. Hiyo8]
MEPIRVVLLPGSVLPAEPAYGALIEALGPDVDAVAKDLELYDGDEPPPGWSLDTEIDGVLREAEARGWETFHLLGYSGGGQRLWHSPPSIHSDCSVSRSWSPHGREAGIGVRRTPGSGRTMRRWNRYRQINSWPRS